MNAPYKLAIDVHMTENTGHALAVRLMIQDAMPWSVFASKWIVMITLSQNEVRAPPSRTIAFATRTAIRLSIILRRAAA
jgi:hypothetical protein